MGGDCRAIFRSRKNPVGCIWKTRSARFASNVQDFMQNLSSFFIYLVVTVDYRALLDLPSCKSEAENE